MIILCNLVIIIINLQSQEEIIINSKKIMLILLAATIVFAQNLKNKNQFSGFDKGYINGSYNMYPTFIGKINEEISNFGVDKFDENVFLYGGELCGNMNPSFGVGIQYFFGGDESQNIVDGFTDDNGDPIKLDRSVQYNISFFGLVVNYRKSLTGAIEFFGSISGGYGNAEIIISQDYGDQSFSDLWDSFDPDRYLYEFNRSVRYESGLIILNANNGLRFFVSKRVALGFTVGYTYGFVSDKGEINYGFESVKNVPDLDFDGMNYGIGIYFGY